MKRYSTSHYKSKSRSITRTASTGLLDFLKKKYDKSIPVSVVTAAHKLYGRGRPLNREDKFIKRFVDKTGDIQANKFVNYLSKTELPQKNKHLNEETMKRVYSNCANHDGKLTFEYIMKMGQNCGIAINERMAKAMVRKYGHRKDHLNLEDCMKINKRRAEARAASTRRR